MPGSIVLIRIIVVNDANCLMRSQQLQGFYGGREHCKLSIAHNRGDFKEQKSCSLGESYCGYIIYAWGKQDF